MYLTQLELVHYRNYSHFTGTFNNKINLFVGENAQGKTNLMESIYVLAFAKSHRTSIDKELISWGEKYGKIKGEVQKKNGPHSLELQFSPKGKKAKVNYLEQRKLSDYIGQLNVVMFAPEDLNLVKGSPQVRRKFLDMELGQISPVYIHNLSQYNKILQQRNSFLKDGWIQRKWDPIMLDILNEQLVYFGSKVLYKRLEFIELLQQWATPIHFGISRGLENIEINYKSFDLKVCKQLDLPKINDIYYEHLKKVEEREKQRGLTLVGPHRDDLIIKVNDYNVQTFGSQGQQRTAALSLKLAEIDLIMSETREAPILLLDDVLSELDTYRQSHLLNTIENKVQTFVTTTSVEGIEHKTLKDADSFYIEKGAVV